MKKYLILLTVLIALAVLGIAWFMVPHTKKQTNLANPSRYIAFGDSVAAGVGLSTASDSSACDRTNEAYTHQVSTAKSFTLTTVACSGATLTHGVLGPQDVNGLSVKPQIDALPAQAPTVITITVGANDLNWSGLLAKCYSAICGTTDDTNQFNSQLATVKTGLREFLVNVQAKYKQPPIVVVTGYYAVFGNTATCPESNGLTQPETTWVNSQLAILNDALKSTTTDFAFAHFAAVNFSGHELCTSDSWVQTIADPAPFHPTEGGQKAIAASVLGVLRN